MASTDASPIQVIDRMASLLDALAAEQNGASLKILSAETGLHPSTAFRILASLSQHGFVARDETGLYLLGPHLLQLAAKVRVGLDVRAVARPEMEWLRDQVGETVNLTVRQGDEMVYVERVTPNRMMRVEQLIGSHQGLIGGGRRVGAADGFCVGGNRRLAGLLGKARPGGAVILDAGTEFGGQIGGDGGGVHVELREES